MKKTKLYICDPRLNCECNKNSCCHFNDGGCFLTCYREAAAINIPMENLIYILPRSFKYVSKLIVWVRHIWLSFLYGRKM